MYKTYLSALNPDTTKKYSGEFGRFRMNTYIRPETLHDASDVDNNPAIG